MGFWNSSIGSAKLVCQEDKFLTQGVEIYTLDQLIKPLEHLFLSYLHQICLKFLGSFP